MGLDRSGGAAALEWRAYELSADDADARPSAASGGTTRDASTASQSHLPASRLSSYASSADKNVRASVSPLMIVENARSDTADARSDTATADARSDTLDQPLVPDE